MSTSVAARLRRWLRATTTTRRDEPVADQPWARLHTIATIAGHRPTGLADVGGGYLCACRQESWSNLDEYGPYGGLPGGLDRRA